MFGLGFPEFLVILMLVSILLGANRLPEIGRSLSEAIRENRQKQLPEESIEEGDDFE